MFGMSTTIIDEVDRVRKRARDAERQSFSRTAFLIRKTAVESVQRAEGPSAPGQPVHTHRGNWFRRAIRYDANKEGAVIGPMFSVVGTVGEIHEFGKPRKGQQFPKRPTMFPALQANLDMFANSFKGSMSE